ncbi:3'-5' exonuclease [Pistricoccus aurantiacus]|uniref:3'-5' exonuclease n=1 Tax=Pistricoccus aurantiacus TaxID=1883414 RepID=A0A5B8SQU5_9GAMM|nr:3'-5' exonuclease [Pistricoccus aurantiacus]QEA39519.1 3'-5' exonuclease [Pistricoccus aurantiacus]
MRGLLLTRRQKRASWPGYMALRANTVKDARLKRFYGNSQLAPDTPISEAPLVAMDMETTGLDASRHGIVSVGLIPFNLKRIRLAEKRYWVVRPRRELLRESVVFHHITHSEIANAPDLDDILDELLACLAGRIAVVHFRHIERPFLDHALRERTKESLMFPMIDTMQLEARLHRRRRRIWVKRLLGLRPTSIRLQASRERYHLPAYQSHHALSDALATAELLQAQIANRFRPETPIGRLWS